MLPPTTQSGNTVSPTGDSPQQGAERGEKNILQQHTKKNLSERGKEKPRTGPPDRINIEAIASFCP